MPIISMFYGIIVRLFLLDTNITTCRISMPNMPSSRHPIGIEDGEILAGELPRKQLRLVQAWIELHRDELMADWELAAGGETPYKITPL